MTQTDALRFVPATDADLPLLAQIIRAAFMPVAEELGIAAERVPRFAAFESAARLTGWIAEHAVTMFLLYDGDDAVGCGGCSPDRDDPAVGHLNRIAVRPECQGRGYGKTIVRHLEDELRRRGYGRVRLGHVSANEALNLFYRRLGYEHVKRAASPTWFIEITWMEKEL